MMPPELTALLGPEEKVVWEGQPRPHAFMLRGLPNIAYGITWSVLGACWFDGSGGIGNYSAFQGWWRLTPLFSLPFILAGISFFLYPIRLGVRARHTWYVVTTLRVFTVELADKQPPKIQVFGPANLEAVQVLPRFDGLQDVLLAPGARANPHLKPRLEQGFFGLRDGEEAAVAIRAFGTVPPQAAT